ncbi:MULTISPECIES: ATP-binding protein [unclassified Sphingomonas]|jgi:two-component system phosphate regulon sensor histidine kinase PhoR|uniref:ATP-binding protein n=2 Tax=Sphingomonas TaxID=13687 RepID=UPI000836B5DA|nr:MULTISPECIES: ATP-binding protein [unclassified Sphingomonas]
MGITWTTRIGLALGLIAAAAVGIGALGGDINGIAVALIGGTAAVLLAGLEARERTIEPEPVAPPPTEMPFDEAVEAIIDPVLVVVDNRVVHANDGARTLLGRHIMGEDVRLAIRHPAAAERLLSGSEPPSEPIHLVGLGTRDQRWEMRVRVIASGARIVHLIDRTGSYATEKIRVDFVANASHELRTPLASLLGFIETLQDEAGEDAETRARFLKVMQAEAVRMRRLVDDLMSLSRIEAEKYREPDQQVDLRALIEEVREALAATNDERGGDLITELRDAPPVKGDRAQLSQVLYNLIGNAMKYGRPGTPVTIALRHDGGPMVRLAVADEGEGIAPEHLPRLTERFYRVDSGRSRAAGGTGLGLSIVKHIVERHRGRMDIASTPGVGTVVTVLLPSSQLSSSRNVAATQAP